MSVSITIRDIVKIPVFGLLASAGFLYRAKGIPILAYHSIDDSGSPISLPPEQFCRQMEYLRARGYASISLKEVYNWVTSHKELQEKVVVLTFDDGFESCYENAFPILKRLGLNGTIFLATDYIEKRMTWRKVKGIPEFQMLSWKEIKEMHASGIDFQPHSATHSFLTTVADEESEREIRRSAEAIEDQLGKKPEFFCYPYGDFDENIIKILKRNGFLGACSAVYGKVNPGDNPYILKRIGVEHVSGNNPLVKMLFFKASLEGAMSWYMDFKNTVPWFFHKSKVEIGN